jgi:four helix bundle protein
MTATANCNCRLQLPTATANCNCQVQPPTADCRSQRKGTNSNTALSTVGRQHYDIAGMGNFKDLKVWQRSRALVKDIYRVAAALPESEQSQLAAQMRSAVISIPSNIAEGNGRQTDRDQARCYRIALGSVRELEAQVILLHDLEMLTKADSDHLSGEIDEISRMLNALIRYCVRKQDAESHRRSSRNSRPPTRA